MKSELCTKEEESACKCGVWMSENARNECWMVATFVFSETPPPTWFGCGSHSSLQLFLSPLRLPVINLSDLTAAPHSGSRYANNTVCTLTLSACCITASQTLFCLKRVNNWLCSHVYYSDEHWPVTWVMPLLRNTWCNSAMLYGTVPMHAEDFWDFWQNQYMIPVQ